MLLLRWRVVLHLLQHWGLLVDVDGRVAGVDYVGSRRLGLGGLVGRSWGLGWRWGGPVVCLLWWLVLWLGFVHRLWWSIGWLWWGVGRLWCRRVVCWFCRSRGLVCWLSRWWGLVCWFGCCGRLVYRYCWFWWPINRLCSGGSSVNRIWSIDGHRTGGRRRRHIDRLTGLGLVLLLGLGSITWLLWGRRITGLLRGRSIAGLLGRRSIAGLWC